MTRPTPLDIQPPTRYILNMNAMTRSYLETLIWSETLYGTVEIHGETYEEGTSLDDIISVGDLPASIVTQAEEDCANFVAYVESELGFDLEVEFDSERVGHYFLLSRNRHGSGFFDSEWEVDGVDYSQKLQSAAKTFGTIGLDLWVDNDKLVISSHN